MILQSWKQCGVCRQGRDHVTAGVVCQDNVAHAAKNGVHAIALSDGGGSRKHSDIGSAYATRAACALLVERFDELYARHEQAELAGTDRDAQLLRLRLDILDTVQGQMRLALTPERTFADLGCTLQFAAVKNGRYFVGHVGDGVIAALYQHGTERRVEVLSHPENGGGPNITFFVTDPNASEHLRLQHGECHRLEGLLMMSDGPEEVLYSALGGMHPNTGRLFDNFAGVPRARYEQVLQSFLAKTVAARSFDDLSLNLLYLETVEREKLAEEYLNELLDGIEGAGQLTRISAYAYHLDPSREAGKPLDISLRRD